MKNQVDFDITTKNQCLIGYGGENWQKKPVVKNCRRQQLFLSSANLTEYAFTINMELGLPVTGGGLPKQVQENFQMLINGDVLVEV